MESTSLEIFRDDLGLFSPASAQFAGLDDFLRTLTADSSLA